MMATQVQRILVSYHMISDQLDKVFGSMDVDKSGDIHAEDLIVALDRLGMKVTNEVVASMIAVVDESGDGSVDRDAFHTLVQMVVTRARKRKKKKGMMIRD